MGLRLYVVHGSHPCAAAGSSSSPRIRPCSRPTRQSGARVEDAERWGDEVFQPVARELIWAGFTHSPGAMVSYSEHSRLPLSAPAIRVIAPVIARMGARLNRTDDGVARRARQALPAQLDTAGSPTGRSAIQSAPTPPTSNSSRRSGC